MSSLSALRVMVRGYRDKPALLFYRPFKATHIEVSPYADDWSKTIGWRIEDAYKPDDELFAQLADTYRRGNKTDLRRLWKRAVPLTVALPPEDQP